jgi:hypothetical protein
MHTISGATLTALLNRESLLQDWLGQHLAIASLRC